MLVLDFTLVQGQGFKTSTLRRTNGLRRNPTIFTKPSLKPKFTFVLSTKTGPASTSREVSETRRFFHSTWTWTYVFLPGGSSSPLGVTLRRWTTRDRYELIVTLRSPVGDGRERSSLWLLDPEWEFLLRVLVGLLVLACGGPPPLCFFVPCFRDGSPTLIVCTFF